MTQFLNTLPLAKKSNMSNLGYFHLVGVIFTLWGKIYPLEDKIKWAAFCSVTGLHFFGKQCRDDLFSSQATISPQNEKLKSWWLITIFSNREG